MMPTVTLSDQTFDKLKRLAVPLEDDVDRVVSRIADLALSQQEALPIRDPSVVPDRRDNRASNRTQEDLGAWRRRFWREILDYIASRNPPFRVQSPSDDSWTVISLGRSSFKILLTLTPKRGCIGCELYFDVFWKDRAFDQLLRDRDAIESELGTRLTWNDKPGRKSASVYVERNIDPMDDSNRDEIKQWMYEQSLNFHRVFRDRVMRLD